MTKPKPNAPCPCGSGKKYKNCCGKKGGKPKSPRGRLFWSGAFYLVLLAAAAYSYLNIENWTAPKLAGPPPVKQIPRPVQQPPSQLQPAEPPFRIESKPHDKSKDPKEPAQPLPPLKLLNDPDEIPPALQHSLDSARAATEARQQKAIPSKAADSAGR